MSPKAKSSVLVPIDFSDASLDALREALTLVDSPSHVHAVHVVPDPSPADLVQEAMQYDDRAGRAMSALTDMLNQAGADGVQALVREGSAGEVIADLASELGCELIVMPTRGRKGVSRLLLGSVAERVLRLAQCPILVIRGPGDQ